MSLSNVLSMDQPLKGLEMVHCGPERLTQEQLDARLEQERAKLTAEYEAQIKDLKEGMLDNIHARYEELEKEVVARMPGLVDLIVKRVWGGIELEGEVIGKIVDEVIGECNSEVGKMEVSLSGEDHEKFLKSVDVGKYKKVEFVVDEGLSIGDCVLKSEFGSIDGRVETKLERVQEEIK